MLTHSMMLEISNEIKGLRGQRPVKHSAIAAITVTLRSLTKPLTQLQ